MGIVQLPETDPWHVHPLASSTMQNAKSLAHIEYRNNADFPGIFLHIFQPEAGGKGSGTFCSPEKSDR
jgi:hypothetical protein